MLKEKIVGVLHRENEEILMDVREDRTTEYLLGLFPGERFCLNWGK